MANHVWSGCGVLLSIVGLAMGVVNDKPTESDSSSALMPVPKDAVAVLRPTQGEKVRGVIRLTQEKDGISLSGTINNLSPGEHGFHIHEFGDLRGTDGAAAGGHYNPEEKKHGGPDDSEHHAGDLGNITANAEGVAEVRKFAKGLKLHFVIGRSLVVHGGKDDLKTQPSGDAGSRAALGVIGFAGPAGTKKTPPAK